MCRRLIYLISIVFLLVAVPAATHAQVVNLALNPSFEEDDVVLDDPDWYQWATWNPAEGTGSNATIVDTDAVDGAKSLRIEPVGVENWHFIVANISFPLELGADFTSTFWAKAEADRPLGFQVKAADNSVTWGYTDFQLTTEWAEYSATSTAESNEGKLEFLCAGVEVPFLLDLVSVFEADTLSGLADVNAVDGAIISIRDGETEYLVADGDLILGTTTRWYVLDGVETLWAEGDPVPANTVSGTSDAKEGDVGSKADNFMFTIDGGTNISSIDGIDFQETIFPSLTDTFILFERGGNDAGMWQAIYADGSLGAPVEFVKASDGGPYADTGVSVNGQNAYGVVFKTSVPVQGVRITASGHDTLSISAVPGPNIAWVSYHGADDEPHADAAAVGFTLAPDIDYTNLLKAQGYNVVRVLTSGTPDVEFLNTMDLVIISRTASSGHYGGDGATLWNSITAPMINLNGYTLRSSRLGFTDGTDMPDTTGDIRLTVTDPTHPIFAGISLTDGTMDNLFAEGAVPLPTDGVTLSRGISINNNNLDDEGTVLATIAEVSADTGPVGGIVIAEWPAGAMLTHDGGAGTDVLGGPRLVFLTGSREPDGVTGGQAAALYDLYADGEQMFLNAVKYMLNPPAAAAAGFLDDFNRSDGDLGNDWTTVTDGTIEVKIVDNEVLIAGEQATDWARSGLSRAVGDETRISFDFKGDDNFNVHVRIDGVDTDAFIEIYTWGGPLIHANSEDGSWPGWSDIAGSEIIAGEYNNLVLEQIGTDFMVTLNDVVVATLTNTALTDIGTVLFSCDSAAGTVGSIRIDNVVLSGP